MKIKYLVAIVDFLGSNWTLGLIGLNGLGL
jgi:hypothetical protein